MSGPGGTLPALTPVAQQAKRALRRAVLDRRRALAPADLARAAEALAATVLPLAVASGPVAAYVSRGSEPGTEPLLAALAEYDVEVRLPVLLDNEDLEWAVADPAAALVGGPRGLLEPSGPRLGRESVADCGLLVVPALAVDRAGVRLGRGGGSYDRALARCTGTAVALLHDGELVDDVPAEPHDRPVGAAVTPAAGLVELRRSASGGMER